VNDITPAPSTEPPTEFDPEVVLLRLRRKEGTWVEWGQDCQQLQKNGYTQQQIFEASGFEPIHQNQLMVAAQVFASMAEVGVQPATTTHFTRIGSDSLYELRILSKKDRAAVADFLVDRGFNSEIAKEVAKAAKDYADLRQLPTGFTDHPGDAVAYQYWRYASQQHDLMEKTRLVARGLLFAHSNTARQQIEKLLGSLSQTERANPKLPLYRLESDEELPRFLPVAGKLPLKAADVAAIPRATAVGAFSLVNTTWQRWVGLPGWQMVVSAIDPIVVFMTNQDLIKDADEDEELLMLVDRGVTEWNDFKYFMVDRSGELVIDYFATLPSEPIVGQLVLVLRPKRMLATGDQHDLWQIEE
jgi:Rubisco Assembly chaperone C-terminal domain/Rubisco accumulation factor 1 alpha helical domain/Rubisco accumulation factor 1 helix turn helix domain